LEEEEVVGNEPPQSTLLILGRTQKIFPLSTAAFDVAQFVGNTRNESQLREKLGGAIVIYRSGEVFRFEKITILGVDGSTFGEKIGSFLTRTKRIRVDLSPVRELAFDDIKSLILRCVELDQSDAEPSFPTHKSIAQILDAIRACATCEAIFDVLQVPGPEDCLDIL
jgi:hypothetical protein